MPTYQYACTSCGEPLEVVQKFSDDPLTVCPACKGVLRKVFSPVGVVFKGSGFYKTDSRTKPGKAKTGGRDESAQPSGDKTSGGDGAKSGDGNAAAAAKDTGAGTSSSESSSSSPSTSAPAKPSTSGQVA
jgi:putative FmdB family regulatory protein